MKTSRVIASLLLGIYVMSSCGAMLSVILCHCTRSSHFQAHHSCHHCHLCHTEAGDGIKMPSTCGCNHDHSTEIDLYNYKELSNSILLPIVCAILPKMQEQTPIGLDGIIIKHLDRRKIPLPESDFVALKGLRAPPVIA